MVYKSLKQQQLRNITFNKYNVQITSIPLPNTTPDVFTAPAPPVLPPLTSTLATLICNPPTPHPASTPTVRKACVHLTFNNSKENDMIIIVSFNLICL